METKLLSNSTADLQEAAHLLKEGNVVGIPTETVYGLAADARNPEAVRQIFAAKGRPADNPLIVHIAKLEELESVAVSVPELALKLAAKFWPGPLTMILPKHPSIPTITSGGLDTVGVRMPSHLVARKLIELSGVPIAAPSANISGYPSPTTAQHVMRDMHGKIAAVVDGGDCCVGVESTVIALEREDSVRILRPGYVTKEQMEAVLGEEVLVNHAILEKLKDGEVARSPGMKYKHYAPKADVTLLEGSFEQFKAYVDAHADQNPSCLCFTGEAEKLGVPCVEYGREGDGADQAKHIFRSLRALDEQGDAVVYARCPQKDGLSMAVYNRLIRAAAFRVIKL